MEKKTLRRLGNKKKIPLLKKEGVKISTETIQS